MNLPALLFGIVLSTFYGAAFHFWRGGGAARLLLYLILGWVGFWGGHLIGNYFGLNWLRVGTLNLATASIGSFLCLGIGYWLSLVERD